VYQAWDIDTVSNSINAKSQLFHGFVLQAAAKQGRNSGEDGRLQTKQS
jgi:hypothetical protein